MISTRLFIDRCAQQIKLGKPFIAYRHPRGCLLMNTGPIVEEWEEYDVMIGPPGALKKKHARTAVARNEIIDDARRRFQRVDHVEVVKKTKTHKPPAGSIKGLHKAIAQMKKDPRTCPLLVVQFDGVSVQTEGSEELHELFTVPISRGGDQVDA
jgi:hypothetical protein